MKFQKAGARSPDVIAQEAKDMASPGNVVSRPPVAAGALQGGPVNISPEELAAKAADTARAAAIEEYDKPAPEAEPAPGQPPGPVFEERDPRSGYQISTASKEVVAAIYLWAAEYHASGLGMVDWFNSLESSRKSFAFFVVRSILAAS